MWTQVWSEWTGIFEASHSSGSGVQQSKSCVRLPTSSNVLKPQKINVPRSKCLHYFITMGYIVYINKPIPREIIDDALRGQLPRAK